MLERVIRAMVARLRALRVRDGRIMLIKLISAVMGSHFSVTQKISISISPR